MNYPVWEITRVGGGFLIALISILHVYVSHFAVGGGIFIWLTDRKSCKRDNPELRDYVHRHTRFFLYLTMVFGAVSGVGIWFIIALVHPSATSALIHLFVFAWAAEWVCFSAEIAALIVYYYRFNSLSDKQRVKIAFIYALFAWLSLFFISGILSFMLTPGNWNGEGGFFRAFFNPGLIPSVVFRTFTAGMIAGIFGFLTSVFFRDYSKLRGLPHYLSGWVLISVIGLIPSAYWYYSVIPEEAKFTAFHLNPAMKTYLLAFTVASVVIFIGGFLISLRDNLRLKKVIALILLATGLVWIGGFEYIREIARKPYIIYGYLYSNSIKVSDLEKVKKEGVLKTARWTGIRKITSNNKKQAGKELFNLLCLSCHTIGGIHNDLLKKIKGFTPDGIYSLLTGMGKLSSYMPPFPGTGKERKVLAEYLAAFSGEDGQKRPFSNESEKENILQLPEFDLDTSGYVLLSWLSFGKPENGDFTPIFSINHPENAVEAILIRRGISPEIASDSVQITVSGSAQSLELVYNPERNLFSKTIPDEWRDSFLKIEAKNNINGTGIAGTYLKYPENLEYSCGKCHKGDREETALNIINVHDRISRTDLRREVDRGNKVECRLCHDSTGTAENVNLSSAIHAFHSLYISENDEYACLYCHSRSSGKLRGLHTSLGLKCQDCHGQMDDFAVHLPGNSIPGRVITRILDYLKDTTEESDTVKRVPWKNQPDCLSCHQDFNHPEAGFSKKAKWNSDSSELYRIRTDYAGIPCAACHSSAHLLYPVFNEDGTVSSNFQPLQYSGKPLPLGSDFSCSVCHTVDMDYPIHHENMARQFRNSQLLIISKKSLNYSIKKRINTFTR